MNIIEVRSPTRVDLAGGTLDLWPLYLFIGGAVTVNVAIDIVTCVKITEADGNQIELESKDLNLKKSFANLAECLRDDDKKLDLLKAQLKFWQPRKGFRLETSSQSPVGGGLGGSSSLTISLLKAFEKLCGSRFRDVHHMVQVAHNIEAEVLNTPTGTQDYYPAASGGINILSYGYDGISQEVLAGDLSVLDENFLLVNTGKSHHSGINNFEVMKRAVSGDTQTLQALKALNEIAESTAALCRKKDWHKLPEIFREELKWRLLLAPEFSSSEIERLARLTISAGADAVKICGAGGGGCVLVWVTPAKRKLVVDECQKNGFQVLSARPVSEIRTLA